MTPQATEAGNNKVFCYYGSNRQFLEPDGCFTRDSCRLVGLDELLPFRRATGKGAEREVGRTVSGGMLSGTTEGSPSPLSAWAMTWRGQAGCGLTFSALGYLLQSGNCERGKLSGLWKAKLILQNSFHPAQGFWWGLGSRVVSGCSRGSPGRDLYLNTGRQQPRQAR